MITKLKFIASGTVFTLKGQKYRHEGIYWGFPQFTNKDCTEEIFGKPCFSCSPFLGGQFQKDDAMRVWIPEMTDVEIV